MVRLEHTWHGEELKMAGAREYGPPITIQNKKSGRADSYQLKFPKILRDVEQPLPEARRASSDWAATVTSPWCDDVGYSSNDPTIAAEKCAICEKVIGDMQRADIWATAMLPSVEERINFPALTDCERLAAWGDKGMPTMSQGGALKFKGGGSSMVKQCEQFRDDLVRRMSPRELAEMWDTIADDTVFEYQSLGLGHREHKCFPFVSEDVVSRVCTMSGCCLASRNIGCPLEHEACTQCQELLIQRSEVGRGKLGFSTMTQAVLKEVDDTVVASLSDFIDGGVERIQATISEIEDKITKSRAFFGKVSHYVKNAIGDLLGHLHPLIDGQCGIFRKELDLLITERARAEIEKRGNVEGISSCHRAKNIGKKRNFLNWIVGQASCLQVFYHIVQEKLLGAEKSGGEGGKSRKKEVDEYMMCGEVLDDVLDRVGARKARSAKAAESEAKTAPLTLDSFLESPQFATILGGPGRKSSARESARAIAVGSSMECCTRVVRAWAGGETGKSVAEKCDSDLAAAKDDALKAALLEYRGTLAAAFTSAHHVTPEEGNKDTHPTGTIATAKSLHEAIALVRQGGNKDAVAGVLRLKEEVTDLAVGEHPWSMLAEQDRHDEKLAQWKRLLELAKSRATAARQDEVGITSHVFTMSSKERWKDIRARLPESVRQLDKCLRGSDEVNPVLATKDFDAIGSDFVEWSQSSQVPRGMPTTPEGFCGLLYDQCRDDSDAAKYAREQKCREY